MRRALIGIVLAVGLAGCGGQSAHQRLVEKCQRDAHQAAARITPDPAQAAQLGKSLAAQCH